MGPSIAGRAALVLGLATVFGVAVALGDGGRRLGGVAPEPPVALTPSVTAVAATGVSPPAAQVSYLDERQVALVRSIALGDDTVRELLGGRAFEVREVGAWTALGGVNVLGGVVELCVDPALHGRFRVPVISFDEATEEEPYTRLKWTFDFTGRTSLQIWVDLALMEAVSVRPGLELHCS